MNVEYKTGEQWSNILGIEIIDPCGWVNVDVFKTAKVSREEFANRAANSKIKFNTEISRRELDKVKAKFKNN